MAIPGNGGLVVHVSPDRAAYSFQEMPPGRATKEIYTSDIAIIDEVTTDSEG